MLSPRRFTGTVLFFGGVGCATAVIDEDPSGLDTVAGPPKGSGGTGMTATAGASSGGAAGIAGSPSPGGTTGTCPSPRTPAEPGATQGNSGSFETTEAVCYFVEGSFNEWDCSNVGGRTVTVNGALSTCGGALPAKIDGGYYFEFGASTDGTNYTSFYWYTS